MGSNIFSIGVSGLMASQYSLSVVSQNISNVNTPGYNRQFTSQASRLPQDMGFGFIGKGVDVTQVSRSYDNYLDSQVLNAQSNSNYYSSQLSLVSQIDNMVGDPQMGLAPGMSQAFTAMQALSSSPPTPASRKNALDAITAMTTRFTLMDSRLQEIQSGVNQRIVSTVNSINALGDRIASLNVQIQALAGSSQIRTPNDLLDQRDAAMQDLNKLIGAKSLPQPDGTYSVFIGNGQSLVLGANVNHLGTQPDPLKPYNQQVTIPNGTATPTVLSSSALAGGDLTGLMTFRDTTLLTARQQLGNLAIDLTGAMNYQNQLGVDANKNTGGLIFASLSGYAATPETAVANMKVILGDPNGLAMASRLSTTGIAPAGTGVTVSSAYCTLPDYRITAGNIGYGWPNNTTPPNVANHPINGMTSITINAATPTSITATIAGGTGAATPPGPTYNVVPDTSTGANNAYKLVTQTVPPLDIGFGFTLSQQPVAGLAITMGQATPATFAVGDNSNGLQMTGLQQKPLVDNLRNGTGFQSNFQANYATTVSMIGNNTSTVQLAGQASDTNLKQTTLSRADVSAVNLDQEAADLIKFQQSYQASSKVISIAQQIFSQLLQLN